MYRNVQKVYLYLLVIPVLVGYNTHWLHTYCHFLLTLSDDKRRGSASAPPACGCLPLQPHRLPPALPHLRCEPTSRGMMSFVGSWCGVVKPSVPPLSSAMLQDAHADLLRLPAARSHHTPPVSPFSNHLISPILHSNAVPRASSPPSSLVARVRACDGDSPRPVRQEG